MEGLGSVEVWETGFSEEQLASGGAVDVHFSILVLCPVDQAEGPPAHSPDHANLANCQVMIIVSSLSHSAFCLFGASPLL